MMLLIVNVNLLHKNMLHLLMLIKNMLKFILILKILHLTIQKTSFEKFLKCH